MDSKMKSKTLYQPWQCVKCKRIYESLDRQGMGKGRPGKEPEYTCPECLPKETPRPKEDWEA